MTNLSQAIAGIRVELGKARARVKQLHSALLALTTLRKLEPSARPQHHQQEGKGNGKGKSHRRSLSKAARRRIAQAQKKRWAKFHREQREQREQR